MWFTVAVAVAAPNPDGGVRISSDAPCLGAFYLRFLPGGERVLSLDEKTTLVVCDLRTGSIVSSVQLAVPGNTKLPMAPEIRSLVVSPDGTHVALVWRRPMLEDDAFLAVWPVGSAEPAWTAAHAFRAGRVTGVDHTVTFSGDGAEVWLASVDGRAPLRRFDTRTGALLGEVAGVGVGYVYGSPNWLFDRMGGVRFEHPLDLDPAPGAVLFASGADTEDCFDGRCVVHAAPAARVNPRTGTITRLAPLSEPAVRGAGASLTWRGELPDGQLVLIPAKGEAIEIEGRVAPLRAEEVLGRDNLLAPCAWSPDGNRLAIGLADRSVVIDLQKGNIAAEHRPAEANPVRVWSTPDGPFGLAWYEGGEHARISVFDTATGNAVRSLEDAVGPKVEELVFLPDGTGLIAASATALHIHDLQTHTRRRLELGGRTFLGLIDGTSAVVAAVADRKPLELAVIHLADGKETALPTNTAGGAKVEALRHGPAWAPSGLVAFAGDTADGSTVLVVVDAAAAKVLWQREVSTSWRDTLIFSPHAAVLRLGHSYFEARTGTPTTPVDTPSPRRVGSPRETWGAATVTSPDGSKVAEGSWLGTVWVYPASP